MTSTPTIASGTQTNFPMLVSSTVSSWASSGNGGNVQNLTTAPNGVQEPADLVFATSSANCGTANLNFETESYTSSTGALIDWVNVPSLSAGSVIYACYDNSSVTTDQSHPSSTWNSQYQDVFHFPNGTILNASDSTANANNGTIHTVTATTTGEIDGAGNYNGSSDITLKSSQDYYNFTAESWVNYIQGGQIETIVSNKGTGCTAGSTNDGYALYVNSYNTSDENLVFEVGNNGGCTAHTFKDSTTLIVPGKWTDVAVTYASSTGSASLFVNGSLIVSTSSLAKNLQTNSSTNPFTIGAFAYNTNVPYYISGRIDETRISNAVLSPSWILTEYNNQSSPSTFYAVGAQTAFSASDTSPPTPNPMAFASGSPTVTGTSTITMSATTTATDATLPVYFQFANVSCTSNGGSNGTSSTWITTSSFPYSNAGLQANECYAYTVQARDSVSPTPNTGTASASSSIYTYASTPGTPTLNGASTSTLNITVAANGNPSSNPTTLFSVQVTSTSPTDNNTLGKFIDSAGAITTSAVWLSAATWNAVAIKNLQANTTYGITVQAENNGTPNIATAWSAIGSGTTNASLPGTPGTPTYSNVSTSTMTVSWTSATNATYYDLERGTNGNTFAHITTTTAPTATYNDSGLSISTTYYYRVRGNNSSGDGSYSASSSQATTSGNSSPNAPSADSPANALSDVSTAPVFKMTATDPNSDTIRYKVIIYSNSGCTTIVQTNDQNSSQTGWSGQNASSSTSYTSGTQGTYTVQSNLSSNTTYYWQTYAIDPSGSNTWSSASACQNFTTTYGNWVTDSGSWSISSSQLVATPTSSSIFQIHASTTSQTNAVVDFKMKASATGANTGSGGAVLRADTGSNRYLLPVGNVQNNLSVVGATISNAYSTVASTAFTFSAATFYQFRGSLSGTSLKSWINGGTAISASTSSLGSSGFSGLYASSTNGSVTFTYDNFALYNSTTITLNNLPAGGSWAVRNSAGTVIAGSCTTGSTWDLSTYNGQVPIDYDNGGGSIAIWTGSTICSGAQNLTYPASGLATDIFGGDVYSYNGASQSGGVSVVSSSTININSTGLITY